MPLTDPPEGWGAFRQLVPEEDGDRFVRTFQLWIVFCQEIRDSQEFPQSLQDAYTVETFWSFPYDKRRHPSVFFGFNIWPSGKITKGVMEYEWQQVEYFLENLPNRQEVFRDALERCHKLAKLDDWPSRLS